jgi:2-keto-4-pentenoate hydratase/2-oxohepta-3-ene-1,7-dioic acid hydratase in catechol pathway
MLKKKFTKLVRTICKGELFYGEAIIDNNGTISAVHKIEGDIYGTYHITDTVIRPTKLLSPILPTNIVCIGLNYTQHAKETNLPIPTTPIVFMKTLNSLQDPFEPIIIPRSCISPPQVDYEAELAVVIGKTCKNVTVEEALDYVLGYTCANDVSARIWQSTTTQWCYGKSFDTFCPLGPVLVSPKLIPNPNNLKISATLNGTVMQKSNTSDMIFNVKQLISFLSQGTTLLPGTVILTGTPEGVGFTRKPPIFLARNDTITIEIESIGKLTNPVVEEKPISAL